MEGHGGAGPGEPGGGPGGNKRFMIKQGNLLLNALQTNPFLLQKVKEKVSNIGSKIPDTYKDYIDLLENDNFKTDNDKVLIIMFTYLERSRYNSKGISFIN